MRSLGLALLASLILVLPVHAQQGVPSFRLGVGDVGLGTVVPDPDGNGDPGGTDDDDEIPQPESQNAPFSLSYDDATINLGQSVNLEPTLTGDLSGAFQEWISVFPMPNGLTFDDQTGIISGTPTHAGTMAIWIKHSRLGDPDPSQPDTWFTDEASAHLTIQVQAGYAVVATPSTQTMTFGTGTDPAPVTFTASTVPPQTGGHFGVDNVSAAIKDGSTLIEDVEGMAISGNSVVSASPSDDSFWGGTFQFYYEEADGDRVYGPLTTLDVVWPPYWDFRPANTPSYVASYGPMGFEVQIIPGTAFKIQPYAGEGAVGVPSNPPAWVPPVGSLPPGVTISATGAVKGTTTASAGSTYSIVVPAKTADDRYGWSEIAIKVVDELEEGGGGGLPTLERCDALLSDFRVVQISNPRPGQRCWDVVWYDFAEHGAYFGDPVDRGYSQELLPYDNEDVEYWSLLHCPEYPDGDASPFRDDWWAGVSLLYIDGLTKICHWYPSAPQSYYYRTGEDCTCHTMPW